MYKEDTIAAVATPPGEGGIAIIRISGPDAEAIAKEIFLRPNGKNGALRSHRLYYGTIRDPKSRDVLDEVLLALMRKPRSYTGEDVVEVHCHGGPVLVRELLELVLSFGVRHADAGEFTKRAFLNGRIDLAQAEAVDDLIRARTDKGIRLAATQFRGELSKWVGDLRDNLLDLLVQVEAAIDFPEEEIELLQRGDLALKMAALREKIVMLIASYEWGRLFREGARACICGRPNVGKSSLLNALLGEDRVIVTPIPGTTRDVIEESINLSGLPVVLWDTAGIHDTDDQVERIGVEFSRKYLREADIALVVLDGSVPLGSEDRRLIESLRGKKSLIVINKNDLTQQLRLHNLEGLTGGSEIISVSAKQGKGLDQLKQSLRAVLLDVDEEPAVIVTNVRHRAALVRTEQVLTEALVALKDMEPPEIVAIGLQEAQKSLEEIIGVIRNDDILKQVFTNFCIGK